MKFGLRKAPNPPRLRFGAFFNEAMLPAVPATFGHYNLIGPQAWGMLGNDDIGDCTIAGPMHCAMLWNKIVGRTIKFTTADAVSDYSAVSGYVPGDDSTDNGADMVQVAAYWQKTGMRDSRNQRHKIYAYLQIDATNLAHLDAACYLFDGGVGLGVQVPSDAQDQFTAGKPWSVTPGATIEGYHYVPYVGKAGNRKVVTWGALQEVEDDWLAANLQEAVVMISQEALTNGKSAEGFNLSALAGDLETLA